MNDIFASVKERLTMRQVAEHFNFSVNGSDFIFSPFRKEKTASCKLYKNSFFDFSTNTGGDLINFTAAVLDIGNLEACQYLVKAFSLPVAISGVAVRREEMEQLQKERQRKEEREQEFKEALLVEIDCLKCWVNIYRTALEKRIYEPFSDMWSHCINELQKAEYKLDILCAADQATYRRMKSKAEIGLPSDRPQWLLDALPILAEEGAFQVTGNEVEEIKAWRNSEQNRQPENTKGGGVIREQEQENLRRMNASDLIKLLENWLGEN